MAERVLIVDDELAELLRLHLPRIVAALDVKDPTAGLTVEETARHLRLSKSTTESLITEGTIRSVRFGRRVIVPRSEVDRILDTPVKNIARARRAG